MSFKVRLDGYLARALEWEAARKGNDLQVMVLSIVRGSSHQILTSWRRTHMGVALMEDRRSSSNPGSVEEVLRKARGPRKR